MKDFFSSIQDYFLDIDRIPVAMAALLLTAFVGMITGPMHGNANPFLWKMMNGVFGGIGARLDRPERSPRDLMFRGLVFTIVVLIFFYIIGSAADEFAVIYPWKGFSEILLLSLCLTSGTVWFSLLKLYFAQRDNKVSKGAFFNIAFSTRTDLSSADNFGITRTGMSYAAFSFDKGMVAPVLWYLIAGLAGAYIYAGLAALSWRFGREGFTKGFGAVAVALEKLMGFVPGMLSGSLMAASGLFTPTGGMTRSFRGILSEKGKAPYEQGGLPLTAMTHCLDVSLGGPSVDLEGYTLKKGWYGPENATARLENGHLRRALYMSLMAHALLLASLFGALLWAGRLF